MHGGKTGYSSCYLFSETLLNDIQNTVKRVGAAGSWAELGLLLFSFSNFPGPQVFVSPNQICGTIEDLSA